MKTFSAGMTLAAQRPHAAPRFLLQLDFTAPSAYTLRVSDQHVPAALGQEWLAFVADWGTLEEALTTVDVGGRPATAEITFLNTKPVAGKARLSDLIRTAGNTDGAYEFAFAKVTVYWLESGLGSGSEIRLGVFYLEEPTEIDEERLRLRMSDQSLKIENQCTLLRISEEVFPDADPDDVGEVIPVALGALAGIPARAIVAGARTTLSADAAVSATTLTVTDTSDFPAPPFTIQLDTETRTCSAKNETTLTIDALTAAHVLGATVWEVRSGAKAYRFVVCENPRRGAFRTKAVSKVYANGIHIPSGYTIDLDDRDLVPGRSFVVVNFSTLPWIRPQDNIDTIDVDVTSVTTLIRVSTNQPVTSNGTPPAPFATMTMPSLPAGAVVSNVKRTVTYRVDSVTGTYVLRRDGVGGTLLETIVAPHGSVSISWSSGTTYGDQSFYFSATGSGISITIEDFTEEVEATVPSTTTKTGTVALSGTPSADVLFTQKITVDLEGLQDDDVGSISGTRWRLLENPADCAKLFLLTLFPGITAQDLGASWAASRAALGAYRWAGLVGADAVPKFSDLRQAIELQARSRLFLEGGLWEFRYRRDAPAADVTLDYRKDIAESLPARVRLTPRTQVYNSLTVYSGRDFTKRGDLADRYRSAPKLEDLSSIPEAIQRTLELPLVQDAATAALLGAFWLRQWKRQRWEVQLEAFHNVLALEKLDHVAVDHHPILAAHGGTGVVFEVTGKRYQLGAELPTIALTGIEVGA